MKFQSFWLAYKKHSRPSIIRIALLGVVQISESVRLLNVYIFNGAHSIFYLMLHKISLNVGLGFARVRIKGILISEGLL